MDCENNYSVVYSFKLKNGKENEFIENWKFGTRLIYEYEGSLGSRLHKIESNMFMAYALWPDKKTFDEATNKIPSELENKRIANFKNCVDEFKVIFKSEVVSDLINSEVNI